MVENYALDCKIQIDFSQNRLAETFLDHHIASPHNPNFTKPSILFLGHFSPIEPNSRQLCPIFFNLLQNKFQLLQKMMGFEPGTPVF